MKKLNSEIILSICIATYNREKYIVKTLDSIISQIKDKNIEIVIADGASTDNSELIISKYASLNNQVKYHRLKKKGGVDNDYNMAVQFATGKYCWLFTDDDFLEPFAIEKVIEKINLNYDLIVVNADVYDRNINKLIYSNRLKFSKNKIYNSNELNLFFKDAVEHLSFIGCVIIKRDLWLKREKEKYYGTEFVHVGVIFQELFKNNIYIISRSLIKIRFDNAQWTSRSFHIWLFKWPNLLSSFKLISKENKLKYSTSPSFYRLKKILEHRASNTYNYKVFKDFFLKKNLSIFWIFILYLISIYPSKLLHLLINFYVVIKNNFSKNVS
jgi:abequosyltransferase